MSQSKSKPKNSKRGSASKKKTWSRKSAYKTYALIGLGLMLCIAFFSLMAQDSIFSAKEKEVYGSSSRAEAPSDTLKKDEYEHTNQLSFSHNKAITARETYFLTWKMEVFLIFLLVLSCIINFLLLRSRGWKIILKDLAGQKRLNVENVSIAKRLPFEVNELESTIRRKEDEIQSLSEKNKKLKTELELLTDGQAQYQKVNRVQEIHPASLAAVITPTIAEAKLEPVVIALEAPKPTIISYYFQGPYEECKFFAESGSDEKKFRYLYRIETIENDSAFGKLYLEPSSVELDILRNYSDTILKPACEYTNGFHSSFGNVSMISPGRVVRQGDDWIVKEKVQIKFT